MTEAIFFKSQKEWRAWLLKNHATKTEAIVGYHKGAGAKGGFTHKQAIDEALWFGWIDSVAKGGDTTWSIRFTPRKAKSIWSQVNIKRIEELKAAGQVHAAGHAAYDGRDPKLQKKYSFENRDAKLSAADDKAFRANKQAWKNFEAMPPSYRHPAIWWVVSAKQEATRERRLAQLIADSAAGKRLKHLTRPEKKKP
jgi:uncharacterized protein YdeI (YjbR/CyaY-like superfamily)